MEKSRSRIIGSATIGVAVATALLYGRFKDQLQNNLEVNLSPNSSENFSTLVTPEPTEISACFQFPIRHPNASVTQKFWSRVPNQGEDMIIYRTKIHPGWDVGIGAYQPGEPIYPISCDESTVLEYVPYQFVPSGKLITGYDDYLGNTVVLDQGKYISIYSHLNDILVRPGQIVNKDQPIGTMGDTGYWGNNVYHLHLELMHKVGEDIGHINPWGLIPTP